MICSLLTDSPDPDSALLLFERLVNETSSETLRLMESHPFLAHYAGLAAARRWNVPVLATCHTNFEDYLQAELGFNVVDGTVASEWGLTQLATFPIGIDVDDFAARATKAMSRPEGDQRLWFVIDELDALGNIDGLKDALARLRKFGGRCVLG